MQREASGVPIDQRWLETLSDKLEYVLTHFAETAREAQSEASDHRGAIGVQIETAMARSETEMEHLRDSLA